MTAPAPRDGVSIFIPRRALLIGGCATVGLVVMALILLIPRLGVAVGAGIAATTLIYTLATPGKDPAGSAPPQPHEPDDAPLDPGAALHAPTPDQQDSSPSRHS